MVWFSFASLLKCFPRLCRRRLLRGGKSSQREVRRQRRKVRVLRLRIFQPLRLALRTRALVLPPRRCKVRLHDASKGSHRRVPELTHRRLLLLPLLHVLKLRLQPSRRVLPCLLRRRRRVAAGCAAATATTTTDAAPPRLRQARNPALQLRQVALVHRRVVHRRRAWRCRAGPPLLRRRRQRRRRQAGLPQPAQAGARSGQQRSLLCGSARGRRRLRLRCGRGWLDGAGLAGCP